MPDPIGSINEAIILAGQLLDRLRFQPATFNDTDKAAIRAVWRAVDQTKLHMAAIRKGHAKPDGPDAPTEKLADLWSDASLAIVDIDRAFARRLRVKAEYWTDPHNWHGEPGLDISIESVATAARSLLPRATRKEPDVRPAPRVRSDIFSRVATAARSLLPRATRSDIFLSHASEDKEDVAQPLADALGRYGYTVWIDSDVLRIGGRLLRNIDAALRTCRYGVVILSLNYFEKEWTQRELGGLVAMEVQDRRKRILPVLHGLTIEEFTQRSPTLADRVVVSTDLGMNVVVSMIVDELKRVRISMIVSGGQAGAERAALDWALSHFFPSGGWCPKGRKAEDEMIDWKYRLNETPSACYLERTEWNVRDSDATVLFSIAPTLSEGSKKTIEFARKHNKPSLHLHAHLHDAAQRLYAFLQEKAVETLNVSGSRASKEPNVAQFVIETFDRVLKKWGRFE
jgi:Circularly permutated YpsA SLOG family/TIR domain